jgi:beta-phosphoglucomutase
VLFDFDGVIAETMSYHVAAWQKAFANYQIEISTEDIYLQEGQFADIIAQKVATQKGAHLSNRDLQLIVKNKRALYENITRAKVYPETKTIVEQLKRLSIKLGIVTGSILSSIKVVTGDKFLENFDCIVTGDSVTLNKPHPEPYLTAAKKLGAMPEECLVFENAPLGIKAAKAAGMFCVAVKTTIQDNRHLQEAVVIVEKISALPIEKYF